MRRWFREFWAEVRARRAGRQAMGDDKSTFRAARGIVGATGASFSNAWEYLERDGNAYLRSMEKEPTLPPSLFISERDRIRHGHATPLVERCIEDHGDPDAIPIGEWDIGRLEDGGVQSTTVND